MVEGQTGFDDLRDILPKLGEWWKSKTPAQKRATAWRVGATVLFSGASLAYGFAHWGHPLSTGHEGALPPTPDPSGANGPEAGASTTAPYNYNGPPGTVEVTCAAGGHPIVHTVGHEATIKCITKGGVEVNVMKVDGINTIGEGASVNPVTPVPLASPEVINVGFVDTTGIMTTGEINRVIITGATG